MRLQTRQEPSCRSGGDDFGYREMCEYSNGFITFYSWNLDPYGESWDRACTVENEQECCMYCSQPSGSTTAVCDTSEGCTRINERTDLTTMPTDIFIDA
ncbi:unnamed protein product [Moneuplotes crassus]|uniref:Uncharacterized protein n=1 Tax=Euplotes crassus TaxID=5936 RepID=A0AAD1U7D4_EUPCR|nr:unnamed protein product [Moneuplotes crassus]